MKAIADKRKSGVVTRALTMLLLCGLTAQSLADNWTPDVRLVLVEPLVSFQGGLVRVVVDTSVSTTPCGNGTVLDFAFTGGTQESRSAAVSGLYMALAADKRVRFYVSSSSCSPAGAPLITGLDVIN